MASKKGDFDRETYQYTSLDGETIDFSHLKGMTDRERKIQVTATVNADCLDLMRDIQHLFRKVEGLKAYADLCLLIHEGEQ